MLVIYNSEGTLFSSDTYYTCIFFLFNLRDIHSMLYNFIFFKTDTIFSVLPVTIMIQCFQCGVQNNSVSIFLICVIPAYTFHMVSHYIFNKDCFHCVHCLTHYYVLYFNTWTALLMRQCNYCSMIPVYFIFSMVIRERDILKGLLIIVELYNLLHD